MIAIARYALSDYAQSQRFLPPLVAYLGTLAILYAFPPGPILPAYGLTAALILPVCAWLTVNLHNSEDPVQAGVTFSATRRTGRPRAAGPRWCPGPGRRSPRPSAW